MDDLSLKYLLEKYNVAAPRYTSYPTVPYWDKEKPDINDWVSGIRDALKESREISLYFHLPYCESLCTFCGCNKRITKNHEVELPYIEDLLAEWEMYLNIFPVKPTIKEIHLGGGTPTFFQAKHLEKLISGILKTANLSSDHEFGFEVHPNSTTKDHLRILYDLGFKRISIGVQDFDDDVLKIINRRQTREDVERVTREAREIGFNSVNYDLIFGLPLQTKGHIKRTMDNIKEIRPDRIAFYSYAHVPWIKPSQRAYSESDLPKGNEKRALYEYGRELLEEAGYREIGMDHFALPTDSLHKAMESGGLHRNFMGYAAHYTRLMIGLGVSSISDSWNVFVQNEKKIEDYRKVVREGKLPFYRGHRLTEEDQILRKHILNIMCRYGTNWQDDQDQCASLFEGLERLKELEEDGLVEVFPFQLKVTEAGRPFIRNICMALDARYWRKQPEGLLFSKVV